jgi:hypothetical protein
MERKTLSRGNVNPRESKKLHGKKWKERLEMERKGKKKRERN